MDRLCDLIDRLLRWVLYLLMTVMVAAVFWQVASRLASKFAPQLGVQPSRGTEELASFALCWVALLGAAYVYGRRGHLGFDVLYNTHTPAARRRLDLLIFALELLFFVAVLLIGGTRLVQLTLALGQTTPVLGWPMGLVYSVVPLAGLVMTLHALRFMARRWRGEPTLPTATEAAGGSTV